MKVIVLKVRHKENLDELAEVTRRGRTLDGDDGGWQMPKHAELGDLAIWYAASPDQEYRSYGWVAGTPVKPDGELVKYYGPVAGVRLLTQPVPRHVAAAASGFNEKGVGQLAEVVHQRADDFLLALGFPERFVAARELISDEIRRAVRSLVDFPPYGHGLPARRSALLSLPDTPWFRSGQRRAGCSGAEGPQRLQCWMAR